MKSKQRKRTKVLQGLEKQQSNNCLSARFAVRPQNISVICFVEEHTTPAP